MGDQAPVEAVVAAFKPAGCGNADRQPISFGVTLSQRLAADDVRPRTTSLRLDCVQTPGRGSDG